ncbi:het-6OR heterokaryon incompatibility (het-6OR allele) [Fusarium tjaetaba]|uniref:Het-6OR heterokaryon incompatibility (Het-6OR allele) n=1 Tax=Fusarium tjaetaba TaxID=1567544 RepID=A0A8H5RD81_9HYPO|nr:het-6OR heterokaryon incompatibility (het-6OR allele) [Fusarium tjaetaba]KAF5633655.1 het-6OR heterokaryon incompatibility (het-6OR allele) [Fusarium tjaetaba]
MGSSHYYCLREPAHEIRLLDLLPATTSGDLNGRVRRFSIGSAPAFMSVSHVWGDKKADRTMSLESGCGVKNLPISLNLESFLVNMLCHTSETLPQIWEDSADARYLFKSEYLRRLSSHHPGDEIPFDPMGWDAIRGLLGCEWFHRRWVIQESVLQKTAIFLCGPDSISMDDVFRGIDMAVKSLLARPRPMKKLKRGNTGEVYSLLGVCNSREADATSVRYDLEPEEVYKRSAILHADIHGNLEFLGLCAPEQRNTLCSGSPGNPVLRPFAGPSWVPNWHSQRLRRCLGLSHFDHEESFFNASEAIPFSPSFEGEQLTVSAVLIDKISSIADFCPRDRAPDFSDANSKLYQQYLDFWMTPADEPEPYSDAVSRAEAFIRTLSLDGIYLEPVPSPDDIPTIFYNWCSGSALCKRLETYGFKPKSSGTGQGQKAFIRMKRLVSWDPFITSKGYMGLGREGAAIGDKVWIIGGCSTPVLLSPSTDGPLRYEVKGEIFLDGFMFKGQFAESSHQDSKVERIVLV